MNIIPRSSWTTRSAKRVSSLPTDVNGWVLHWNGPPIATNKSTQSILRGIQAYHMDNKGWSDIAYNFAVNQQGNVYELRGWDVKGAATSGRAPDGKRWNASSRAILFLIGEGQRPTFAALTEARKLIGMKPGKATPHQDASSTGTACPGPDLTEWARNFHPEPQQQDQPKEVPMTNAEAETKIAMFYKSILGHAPDSTGLQFWVDEVQDKGRTLGQVERAITNQALGKLRRDVEALQMLFKGHTADIDGLRALNKVGDGMTPDSAEVYADAVIDQIIERLES